MEKAQIHYERGNCFKAEGLIEKAMDEYVKALKINPNLAKSHNNLGLLYNKKSNKIEALGGLEKFFKFIDEV